MCVVRLLIKISTVAVTAAQFYVWTRYHVLLDCTKLKTSRCKQCKTGEVQPFTCKTAKQAFVGLQVTNSSFSKFHFRDIICTGAVVLQRGIVKKYWSVR